jgi:hypothetical protein
MVFKKTSENGFVFPTSERPPGALLADFDIDGDILKQDHRDWLQENVIKPAKAKSFTAGGWHIDLAGRASKSGSDGHNMWLSDQRIKAVAGYLDAELSGVPYQFFPRQLGESSPYKSDEFEHELDRSVEVTAKFISNKPGKRIKPHILIPKVHPWKPRPNRKVMDFKLQVLKAKISVFTLDINLGPVVIGNGEAIVKMLIDIKEVGSSDHALYEYSGHGPGTVVGAEIKWYKIKPGLGGGEWSGSYKDGDVHSFATDVEMDADDFAGPAAFKFDALGRTLVFGPKAGFISPPSEKIKDLSLGLPDEDLLKYAEGMTGGDLTVVTSTPEWAR